MGLFAYSWEDYKEEMYIYNDKIYCCSYAFDAGSSIIEYKVGDRFRRFELSSCDSEKARTFDSLFYKIFMHGTVVPD